MSVLFAIVLGVIISSSDLVPFSKSNEEISEQVVVEKTEENQDSNFFCDLGEMLYLSKVSRVVEFIY